MDILKEIMEWGWSNIIVAFSTTVLAILTWLLFKETRKTRIYNQSADIVINFEFHKRYEQSVLLVIENIGKGTAYNLKLELTDKLNNITPNIKGGLKPELNQLGMFYKTLPIFKSGQRIEHYFCQYHEILNPEDMHFKIKATYEDINGRNEKESLLQLDFYKQLCSLGHDSLHEIAESQKLISKNIAYLKNNLTRYGRIKVENMTANESTEKMDNIRAEKQARLKETQEKEKAEGRKTPKEILDSIKDGSYHEKKEVENQ